MNARRLAIFAAAAGLLGAAAEYLVAKEKCDNYVGGIKVACLNDARVVTASCDNRPAACRPFPGDLGSPRLVIGV
jgi:hypothetical protein